LLKHSDRHITKKIRSKRYLDRTITKKINSMPDTGDIKILPKGLSEIEERIKKLERDKECLMCCKETSHNIFMVECRHMLCVCDACTNMLDKQCPICRTSSSIITKCFVV
jgi:hypothetical protein